MCAPITIHQNHSHMKHHLLPHTPKRRASPPTPRSTTHPQSSPGVPQRPYPFPRHVLFYGQPRTSNTLVARLPAMLFLRPTRNKQDPRCPSARDVRRNRAPHRHIHIYGSPGPNKTLVARPPAPSAATARPTAISFSTAHLETATPSSPVRSPCTYLRPTRNQQYPRRPSAREPCAPLPCTVRLVVRILN